VQASGQDANVRFQASDNGYATRLQLYGNNVSGASYNAIQSYVNGDSTVQWEISGPKASAEDKMLFSTGGSEAMRIDGSGNAFIGNTAEFVDGTGTGDTGIQLNPIGLTISTRNGGISGIFGRQSSDGDILQFRKNGSTVGSIGVVSSNRLYVGGGANNGIGIDAHLFPTTDAGILSDGDMNLGASNARWQDLYVTGGVAFDTGTAANYLDDYEEGTWTATLYGTTSGTGTNVTHTAHYSKVGNIVTVGGYFQNMNLSSMSGSVNIANLPFTATGNNYTGSIALYGFTFSGFVTPYVGPGGTTIDILDSVSGSAWTGLAIPAAAGKYLMFSLTYRAS